MHIQTLPVGPIQTNCYIVTDPQTKACAIIDPGDEAPMILQYIESLGLSPQAIFLTHGHYDHTLAADDIAMRWDIPVYISESEVNLNTQPVPLRYSPSVAPRFWVDGDEIQVGSLTFQVIATPGHSPGSVCLRVEDCLFTGDTLFRDDCGRTDFPGSSTQKMMESLARIDQLTGIDEVFPGHEESTTLERERRFNYSLRQAVARQQ